MRAVKCLGFAAVVAGIVTTWVPTAEAQWGDIKGRVILADGEIPEAKKLIVRKGDAGVKDAAVCAAIDIPNEDFQVDAATKGIANIAIYLRKAPAKINPALKLDPSVPVIWDQKNCQFLPHVAVVQVGQSVEILNSDAISHNTRNNPIKNAGFNFIVSANTAKGAGVKVPLKFAENVPVGIKCDIHPWMSGYWIAVDHPYAAVTATDGTFSIKGLPAGEHEFRVWHPVGYLEKSLKVVVKAGGETSVPDIKVPSATILK